MSPIGLRNKAKLIDWYILIPVLILSLVGVVMVYSSSSYLAAEIGNFEYFLKRQLSFIGLGYLLLLLVFSLKIEILKNKEFIIFSFLSTLVLLALVLIFGEEVNGAKAWLDLGFFQVQPAEIAKFTIIWYLAMYLSQHQDRINNEFLKVIWRSLLFIAIPVILIAFQPDMGSLMIILTIAIIMVLSSGLDWKKSILTLVFALALVFMIFLLIKNFGSSLPFIKTYQLDRFEAFFDPFSVSDGAGLQLVNSYYALSRGGLTGVGLGNSIQKSGYLPEPHTDFIMAITAEELGLIFTLAIICLFYFLVARIYLVAIWAKGPFNSLMCMGIASMFFIQASINLGGVVGLLPITGVTFPFISYGGSSLLISFLAIAFVLNIEANEKAQKGLKV